MINHWRDLKKKNKVDLIIEGSTKILKMGNKVVTNPDMQGEIVQASFPLEGTPCKESTVNKQVQVPVLQVYNCVILNKCLISLSCIKKG